MIDVKPFANFGFKKDAMQHHFQVFIPKSKEGLVIITEHFENPAYLLSYNEDPPEQKVVLKRWQWDKVAESLRYEFNLKLKQQKEKSCSWKYGLNQIPRLLGKELVLLAWAIEDADSLSIDRAINNWLGFSPEERWWLFTTTNATSKHDSFNKHSGWRKAIQIAFTENPVHQTDGFSIKNVKPMSSGKSLPSMSQAS